MFSATFKTNPVFVLNDSCNYDQPFKLDASLNRGETQSLTKRSARRPYSDSVLCKCQYQVVLKDAAVRAVIGSLRQLNTQPIIIPLWPAIQYWPNRNNPGVFAGLRLAFKPDWSNYALYASTDAEPGWPLASDFYAPALMGFIKPAQPKMLSPDAATWDVVFQEDSPAIYGIAFIGYIDDVTGAPIDDVSGQPLIGI